MTANKNKTARTWPIHIVDGGKLATIELDDEAAGDFADRVVTNAPELLSQAAPDLLATLYKVEAWMGAHAPEIAAKMPGGYHKTRRAVRSAICIDLIPPGERTVVDDLMAQEADEELAQ